MWKKPVKKESILPNSNFLKCENRRNSYTVIDISIAVPSGEGIDKGEQEGAPWGAAEISDPERTHTGQSHM